MLKKSLILLLRLLVVALGSDAYVADGTRLLPLDSDWHFKGQAINRPRISEQVKGSALLPADQDRLLLPPLLPGRPAGLGQNLPQGVQFLGQKDYLLQFFVHHHIDYNTVHPNKILVLIGSFGLTAN